MHFRNLLMEQARIEHAPDGSLLTYITSADALVNNTYVGNMQYTKLNCSSFDLVSKAKQIGMNISLSKT